MTLRNHRPFLALIGLCLVAALAVLSITADLSPAVPIASLVALQASNTTVLTNTLDCQGKGSWANIQIGYTTVLLNHLWPRDVHACAWLDVFIAAPSRSRSADDGYHRAHWGAWARTPFRNSKGRFSVGASWRADRSTVWIPSEMHFA